MRIGLIDIDGGDFPNLVLMKLSAWHKKQGDTVEMLTPADVLCGSNMFWKTDKTYAACVFSWNNYIAEKLEQLGIITGGGRNK